MRRSSACRLGSSEKYIAISNDCNGRYCYLNPRRGALIAMVECLRNLVCAGATPLAMTDNLNFGNPYKPENFYQLKECVAGLAEACNFFDVPVVGGNVSLYNESPEGAIDPTPTVSIVGFIEKPEHVTRQHACVPGSSLVLLGGAPTELGGSQFLGTIHGLKTGDAPAVNLAAEKRLQDFLLAQIRSGAVLAAHDLSEGRPPRRRRRDALRPGEGGCGARPARARGPADGCAPFRREPGPRRHRGAREHGGSGHRRGKGRRGPCRLHRFSHGRPHALRRDGPWRHRLGRSPGLRLGWETSIEGVMKRPGIA